MTPYYADANVTIFHADARDVLPELTASADALIVDPPYGETSLRWDSWVPNWPALVLPTLKPSGSMWSFGSLRMFFAHLAEFEGAGWRYVQEVVWEKHNGSSFHADRFKRVHELAVQWHPKVATWDAVYKQPVTTADATRRTVRRKERPPHTGEIASSYASHDGGPRLMRSVIPVRSCHGYAVHPTQKPEGILAPLIAYSCPPGGVVLDPFMGAGSTLVSAVKSGRRAVGVEVDERYCELAVQRLAQGVLDFGGAA